MKELFEKYLKASERLEEAESAWTEDLMNEDLEEEFDRSYQDAFLLYIELAEKIVEETKGLINLDTAKKIIKTRPNELEKIFSKI